MKVLSPQFVLIFLFTSAKLQKDFKSTMLWIILELEKDNSLFFLSSLPFFFSWTLLSFWYSEVFLWREFVPGSLYDSWPLICVRMEQVDKFVSQLQKGYSLCNPVTGTIEERIRNELWRYYDLLCYWYQLYNS